MRSGLATRMRSTAITLLLVAMASAAVAVAAVAAPMRALPAIEAPLWPPDSFAVLCYHDIRDEFRERPDLYTVETRQLTQQFAWLRAQGYHVISMEQVIASRREHRPLPDRAVVLAFDDGLKSVYTRVFPLLEAFHYAAIVGLVGAWLADPVPGEGPVSYPDEKLSRADFLDPDEIAEMHRSGLIEFASHSYAMHVGIVANPQGNLEPAAASRMYDTSSGTYESSAAFGERIRLDLVKSSDDILRLSGTRPRIIVWPYGDHNHATDRIAEQLGMPYGFTLEVGLNTPAIPLSRLRRTLVTYDFTTADLARVLQETPRIEPLRTVRVDLDDVYDADPVRQEANLSRLLDRVKAMGVNTVFLQASADPGHTGAPGALYFPNRRLPMRADLFNRVAWQLRTRTGVAVYARLPLFGFALSGPLAARQAVRDIYEDLATYTAFQGILFADDASLADLEDHEKNRDFNAFSLEIGEMVRADHDNLRTARSVFADLGGGAAPRALKNRIGDLDDALAAYDFVVLSGADARLAASIPEIAALPGGIAKAVFELRSIDRQSGLPIGGSRLAAQIEQLRTFGARNVGYAPDDFRNGLPSLEAMRPAMSVRAFPGTD